MANNSRTKKSKSLAYFSLRLKVIILLLVFITSGLALFLFLADQIFKEDKIDFLYESSIGRAQSLIGQFKSTMDHYDLLADQIMTMLQEGNQPLPATLQSTDKPASLPNNDYAKILTEKLVNQDRETIFAAIIDRPGERDKGTNQTTEIPPSEGQSMAFKPTQFYFSKNLIDFGIQSQDKILNIPPRILFPAAQIQDKSIAVYSADHILEVPSIIIVKRYKLTNSFICLAISIESLMNEFSNDYLFTNALLEEGGQVFIGHNKSTNYSFAHKLFQSGESTNADVVHNTDGDRLYIGHSKLKKYRVMAVSYVSEKKVFSAIKDLHKKSILFAVMLLSFAIFSGFFFTNRVKEGLDNISDTITMMSEGKDPGETVVPTSDEIALLAQDINTFRVRFQQVLEEKVQQAIQRAKIEKEKEFSKPVSETCLPPETFQLENFEFACNVKYGAASAQSFIFIQPNEGKILFCIGKFNDTSGTLPLAQAFLKSSLMNFAATLNWPNMDIKIMSHLLNNNFYQTFRGKISGNFLLGIYSIQKRSLHYQSFGNEITPFIFNGQRPNEIAAMAPSLGPLLGRDEHLKGNDQQHLFTPHDFILMATQSTFEIQTEQNKNLGHKGILTYGVGAFKKFPAFIDGAHAFRNALNTLVNKGRQNTDFAWIFLKIS